MRPENVNRYLRHIAEEHAAVLASGAIIRVTEVRIQIRTLPLRTEE